MRTEGRERKPKAAEGEREELKTILMTQDQLLLPPPPGKKKENKGEEGEATTRRGGDDLSFFVTIFSSVFPMAGERETEREQENYIGGERKEGMMDVFLLENAKGHPSPDTQSAEWGAFSKCMYLDKGWRCYKQLVQSCKSVNVCHPGPQSLTRKWK